MSDFHQRGPVTTLPPLVEPHLGQREAELEEYARDPPRIFELRKPYLLQAWTGRAVDG